MFCYIVRADQYSGIAENRVQIVKAVSASMLLICYRKTRLLWNEKTNIGGGRTKVTVKDKDMELFDLDNE